MLFRKGVPTKVLPRDSASTRLDVADRLRCDRVDVVSISYLMRWDSETGLATKDSVELQAIVSLQLIAKEDDDSLRRIAVGHLTIEQSLKERSLMRLQKSVREYEYETLYNIKVL